MLYSRETGLKEIRNIFFFFKSLRQRMNCNYCMCDIQRSHSLHFTLAAAVPLTTLDLISAEDVSFHLIKFKFQAFKPKTWRRGLRLKQWGVGSQWQFCARLRSTDFSGGRSLTRAGRAVHRPMTWSPTCQHVDDARRLLSHTGEHFCHLVTVCHGNMGVRQTLFLTLQYFFYCTKSKLLVGTCN